MHLFETRYFIQARVAQWIRAFASGAKGRRFDPCRGYQSSQGRPERVALNVFTFDRLKRRRTESAGSGTTHTTASSVISSARSMMANASCICSSVMQSGGFVKKV